MNRQGAEIVASLPCPVAEVAQKLGKEEEKATIRSMSCLGKRSFP